MIRANEDRNQVMNLFSVSDVDAGSGNLTVVMSVQHGTLTAGTVTGVTVSGSGSGTLTYTGTVAALNTALAANVTYRAALNYNGADTLTITTNDNGNSGADPGLTGTASSEQDVDTYPIVVYGQNDPPVNTLPVSLSAVEDTNLAITGLAISDVDAGTAATISTVLAVAHGTLTLGAQGGATVSGSGSASVTIAGTVAQINATLAASGNVVYRGTADYNGSETLTMTTNDGGASGADPITLGTGNNTSEQDVDTLSFTVTAVNDAPTTPGASITTAEDTGRSGQLTATDVENDALTYALATNAGHGTVTLSASGSYTYTPAADYNGADSFTYTVKDTSNASVTGTVNVTVTPVNDAPVAVNDSVSLNEDTVLSLAAATLLANDTDADAGDTKTLTAVGTATHGSVSLDTATGTVTYTPAVDYNGADSFTYTMQDAAGLTSSATVNVTVIPVNDAPVTAGASISTAEDTAFIGQLTASDVENDALSFALATSAGHGTVTVNADGSYSYTPAANYNGADSFSYTVTDPSNASVTGTVSIDVTAVNDAPVTTGASLGTDEDTPLAGQLAATDVEHDPLSFTLAGDVSNGTLQLAADGSYIYTPKTNFNGNDSFSYTVSDGQGGSATASVSISVASVNDAPTTVASSNSVNEDASVQGQVSAADVDGDSLGFSLGNGVAHGSLVFNADGSYSYTPAANYNGADGFSYTVADGNGGSATASVALTVNPVNDAPVTANASAGTNEDTVLAGQLSASDVDGDTLTYALTTAAAHGSVVVNANGSYSYTPTPNYNGSDSFGYQVSDPAGATAIATVTLSVAAVNDAPVVGAPVDGQSASLNQPFSYVLPAGTFTDADGDALSYSARLDSGAALPAWLQFNAATATFSGTPGLADAGLYSVRITATDPSGASASTLMPVTVLDGSVINGTSGADTLVGTINGDRINGFDGNDSISGGTGADFLDGGNGNDTLNGDAGDDVLSGMAGDDSLTGGDGNDSISGGDGNDTINGGNGNDTINAGAGNDVITTSSNNGVDTIDAGTGADRVNINLNLSNGSLGATIDLGVDTDVDTVALINWSKNASSVGVVSHFTAGVGGDILDYGVISALITGWDGTTNLLSASAGYVRLVQSGADTLLQVDLTGASNGAQFVNLFKLVNVTASNLVAGNFVPYFLLDGSVTPGVTITGDANANTYSQTTTPGTTGGNDTVNALGGNDIVTGGPGDDTLNGGDGNDTLNGSEGNDTLNGNDGSDTLNGNDGSDTIDGGLGNDTIDGGPGNDTVFGGAGNDVIFVASGVDTVDAGIGLDRVDLTLGSTLNGVGAVVDLGIDADIDTIRTISWNGTSSSQAAISHFTPGTGGDKIDLVNFPSSFANWDGNVNPFSNDVGGGYLRLTQSGADTLLEVDFSGNGNGAQFQTLLDLVGVTVGNLTVANFSIGFNPNGGATAGVTITGTSSANSYNITTTPGTTVGDDVVYGFGGNDSISAGAGDDIVYGGDGNDGIAGEAGNDILHGDAGDDSISGNDGNDTLYGDDGNDTLNGNNGADTVYGGNGNDTVTVSGNSAGVVDVIDLGPGVDRVFLTLNTTLNGIGATVDAGIDSDVDTLFVQIWSGLSAYQAVVSHFTPGSGGDVLDFNSLLTNNFSGWDGASNLFGSGFMRALQSGADTLIQVDGNGLTGGLSYQTLATLVGVDESQLVSTNLSPGYNVNGSGIIGQTINGTAGNDTLTGSIGDDTIFGVGGNDTLNGGNGNDNLVGGDGNDILDGGFGRDIYTGGLGSDTFKFALGSYRETVTDFEQGLGGDKLDIKALLSGYTAANAANYIRFDASGADTLLMVDGDGAANGANFQQIATLQLVGITSLADMLANGNLVPV